VVEHEGFCTEGYECTAAAYFDPVCGSDGRTYPNKQALDCYNGDPNTEEGDRC
jgi:hypothetical protein